MAPEQRLRITLCVKLPLSAAEDGEDARPAVRWGMLEALRS